MAYDPTKSQRSRSLAPRRPFKKPQCADGSSANYFADLDNFFSTSSSENQVRSISDPYELLEWVVEEAKIAPPRVPVAAAFMAFLDGLIREVQCFGYLPNTDPPGELLAPIFHTLCAPSDMVRANSDLVALVTDIVLDLMIVGNDQELHSLVRDFAQIGGLESSLTTEITGNKARISSSEALLRTHRVTVDVTVDLKLRRYAESPIAPAI